ncbi:AhpD-like protein [Trichoderma sp. SZMC 28015]
MDQPHRLQPIPPNQLTADQKALFDDIVASIGVDLDATHSFVTQNEDGAFVGPFNGWIHSPITGAAIWNVIKEMRRDEKLPQNLRQIAIVTTGSHFKANYEVYAHASMARQYFSEQQVNALATGALPHGFKPEEELVYKFTKALVQGGPLADNIYAEGVKVLGEDKVIELIFLVGLYSLVSMCLNGFNVPVPATPRN